MIISLPNDGKGYLYHVIDLYGATVHAYRDRGAAHRSLEGEQRVYVQIESTGAWLHNSAPIPHPCLNLKGN